MADWCPPSSSSNNFEGRRRHPPLKTHHATHLFGWTRKAKFRSPADIFSPFGKGGTRGICLSGREVVVPAKWRCPGTMERCQRRKSPLTPLCQRGVTKRLQGFAWSRRIDGVLFTRRVRTTLIGNDDLQRRARKFLRTAAGTSIDRKSTRLNSSHIQKSRMPSSA